MEGRLLMSTKSEELAMARAGAGPLGKAFENEPVFVLRSQDKLAPALVGMWAELAALHGCPVAKVDEARRLAAQMRHWQKSSGRAKYPD
jgi:hypothetical protein